MALVIYLIGTVDSFILAITALSAGSGVLGLFLYVAIGFGDAGASNLPTAKKLLVTSVIFAAFAVLTPNSKTIATMYLLPKIIENKHIQNMPERVLTALEKKIDNYIENIEDKKQ